jgi:hypothetical protein
MPRALPTTESRRSKAAQFAIRVFFPFVDRKLFQGGSLALSAPDLYAEFANCDKYLSLRRKVDRSGGGGHNFCISL